MLLDDLLSSAKQTIAERLASPLLGSFTVSWCLWNYKFLVIIFSSAGVTQTFALIDSIAFPDLSTTIGRGLVFPLATALAYVFLYPYPAKFVYEFTLQRQREINQAKQRILEETPLTLEESRRLRSEMLEREQSYNKQLQALNEQITRLTADLDAKADSGAPEMSTADRIYDQLEPTQLRVLQIVAKGDGPMLESDILQASKERRVRTEFDIGELIKRKLLHRSFDQSRRGYTVEFTHSGRKALLDSKSAEA